MEQKMSVGLDTPIGMPGQTNWGPNPSPLKFQTLDPLPVPVSAEWKNPLSATPGPTPYSAPGSSIGRSPAFPILSPGVSGEIAGVVDNPAPPSTSLSDLFASPDYPFSSVKTRSPNPPGSKRPPNPTPPPQQRPSLRPPQPPSASTAAAHTSRPPTADQKTPTPQPISMAYPTSYVRSGPPHPPTLMPVQQMAHLSQPQQHHPITPQQQLTYTSAPQQPQHISQPLQQVAAPQQQSYGGYSVLPASQHPQNPQPAPQPPRVEQMIAPLPARPGAIPGQEPEKKDSPPPVPTTGHRSVLGSGVVSSAVHEAQVRARMKAETFAKDRKRKRSSPVEEDKPEKNVDEDSKLSPEDLRKKRYLRRLALNRESAAVSRVRRREYVKLLEEQLVNAEKERVRLASELSVMQHQHSELRKHLEHLEDVVRKRTGPSGSGDTGRESY